MTMKPTLGIICVAVCFAAAANAAIEIKHNGDKKDAIKLVSGTWSDVLFHKFGMPVTQTDLTTYAWRWTETNGGAWKMSSRQASTSDWEMLQRFGAITTNRTIPITTNLTTDSAGGSNQTVSAVQTMVGGNPLFGFGFVHDVPQEKGALTTVDIPASGWHGTRKRSSEVKMVLRTGGTGRTVFGHVFKLTATVTEEVACGPGRANAPYDIVDPTIPIPLTEMRIPGLDVNLDMNGEAWVSLPDHAEVEVTPEMLSRPLYRFTLTEMKYPLVVECMATTPTNRWRTTVGVGEEVKLTFSNLVPQWQTTAGSFATAAGVEGGIYTNRGDPVMFIAPSNAVPRVMVNVTLPYTNPVTLKVPFNVLEPTGIEARIRGQAEEFNTPYPRVGAGMFINVVLQPTNVSFYRVQILEPEEPTAGRTGYFINKTPPAHNTANGANAWHPLNYSNLVVSGVFDHASAAGFPIGQSGSYTWPIHPIWRIEDSSRTNSLSGWTDQVHILSSDGTMRVEKLGHHVIRQPYEPRGTVE
jgi:hypothetical protein